MSPAPGGIRHHDKHLEHWRHGMTFSKFGHGEDMENWSHKMRDIMDEMLRRNFVGYRDVGTWQPTTDVYETRDAYYICVELAGMTPEEVDVECRHARCVLVRGYRGNPRPADVEGPLSVHVMEIDHGPFRREIELPEPVDIEAVDARYDKGYLWIKLPKTTTP
ncbi:MAG: Hsp20/alpha crystallin family protein [Planctomycetota bacterium]